MPCSQFLDFRHALQYEALTKQLVSDAGCTGDHRHQLNVSIRKLGKVKEELQTHTFMLRAP